MFFINLVLYYHYFVTVLAYKMGDWRKLPIEESYEQLVEINPDFTFPYYSKEMRLTSDSRVFLRKNVALNFFKAREIVGRYGYELVIYDGWRSLEVQENLFWFYLKDFTAKKFGRENDFLEARTSDEIKKNFHLLPKDLQVTLKEANRKYASWPSSDLRCPSPHYSGGAIDVWLFRNGEPVSLGVPFDWMEEDAGAFFHLKFFRKKIQPYDRVISRRRSILLWSMIRAGFTCYPPEFWHFNFGNQMDSLVNHHVAKYGPIFPPK